MSPAEKAAYIQSQAACAICEAIGMMSENMQRKQIGASMAYSDEDFNNLIERYGIHHNAVMTYLRG